MISIRKATRNDAVAIIEFQIRMAWETEEYTLDRDIVTRGVNSVFDDSSHGQYWVADDDGSVVASLLITYEWSDWRNTRVWWFQSVYVIPEYRRKGIFRSMYSHIKTEAEKQNIAGLRLYVETNNDRARNTYEALGMSSIHYAMYEWLKS